MCLGLALWHARAKTRSTLPADSRAVESTDSSVVLPVVSSAWSNMASGQLRRGSPNASGFILAETPNSTNDLNDFALNGDAVGARAKDLLARAAMESVGLDPEAEQFWLAAINDPNISVEERQELIRGLDQAGFADPRNITMNDLSLIASRIALLEEVAPSALDAGNSAAFQEVYGKLMGMFGSIIATERAPEQGLSE